MSSYFRYPLLKIFFLFITVIPWTAIAQAPIVNINRDSIKERINQLERIFNAHSQLLTYLQKQLSDNQEDIYYLRGQIQENQHKLNQIVEQQKKILMQIDYLHHEKTGKKSHKK